MANTEPSEDFGFRKKDKKREISKKCGNDAVAVTAAGGDVSP